MNVKDAIVKAMQEYRQITGLRSYLIQDVDDINSAAERNYFCKCLKTSARALKHCEECTMENYRSALSEKRSACTPAMPDWSNGPCRSATATFTV
ncbi:MAG: hypothetical protein ACLVJ6_04990 [Merdibacter sp.]